MEQEHFLTSIVVFADHTIVGHVIHVGPLEDCRELMRSIDCIAVDCDGPPVARVYMKAIPNTIGIFAGAQWQIDLSGVAVALGLPPSSPLGACLLAMNARSPGAGDPFVKTLCSVLAVERSSEQMAN